MANPTATSAAATAMIKNTNPSEEASERKVENATNRSLTAFSMSSMLIRMMMAFRLYKTPRTPIVKRAALSRI